MVTRVTSIAFLPVHLCTSIPGIPVDKVTHVHRTDVRQCLGGAHATNCCTCSYSYSSVVRITRKIITHTHPGTNACLGSGEGANAERCMHASIKIHTSTINRTFPSHPLRRVCLPLLSCCGEHRLGNSAQTVCYLITGMIRRRLRNSL